MLITGTSVFCRTNRWSSEREVLSASAMAQPQPATTMHSPMRRRRAGPTEDRNEKSARGKRCGARQRQPATSDQSGRDRQCHDRSRCGGPIEDPDTRWTQLEEMKGDRHHQRRPQTSHQAPKPAQINDRRDESVSKDCAGLHQRFTKRRPRHVRCGASRGCETQRGQGGEPHEHRRTGHDGAREEDFGEDAAEERPETLAEGLHHADPRGCFGDLLRSVRQKRDQARLGRPVSGRDRCVKRDQNEGDEDRLTRGQSHGDEGNQGTSSRSSPG